MATEYKITYTYTGQGNTSSKRTVAINRFKVSGDTDRTIGQIRSITYEHWHTSTRAMTWELRGQLVLSDGTTFVSNPVSQHISGNIVKFTNTFTSLPSAEQFKQLTSVQTLDSQDKITIGGYSATLYWRANSDNPMRVTVTFVEEPPVVYAPEIKDFEVVRCDANGKPDDEGLYTSTTLKLSIGNAAGVSIAGLRVYYAANAYPVVGESEYIDLTARIPELLSGLYDDTTLLPGEWSAGYSWHFAAIFAAGDEYAVDTSYMARAIGSLHVSGHHGGGVCVCGYSAGTSEEPKFESYAPGHFYAGIEGVTNYRDGEVDTGGRWIDGRRIYRRVFMFKNVTTGSGAVTTTLGEIENFSEIDAVIEINGMIRAANELFPLTRFYSTSAFFGAYINNGAIRIRSESSTSLLDWVIVQISYTKSTEEVGA